MNDRVVHQGPGEGLEVLTTVGSSTLVKAADEHTGGAFALAEWELNEEAGPARHTHPHEDESFYVVSGSVDVLVSDVVFTADAGGFVLMPRGVPAPFPDRRADGTRMLTCFSPAGFEHFLKDAPTTYAPTVRCRGRS